MDASPPCTRLPALAAPPRALTPDEEREFAFFAESAAPALLQASRRTVLSPRCEKFIEFKVCKDNGADRPSASMAIARGASQKAAGLASSFARGVLSGLPTQSAP